jgi:hypothetical protein
MRDGSKEALGKMRLYFLSAEFTRERELQGAAAGNSKRVQACFCDGRQDRRSRELLSQFLAVVAR